MAASEKWIPSSRWIPDRESIDNRDLTNQTCNVCHESFMAPYDSVEFRLHVCLSCRESGRAEVRHCDLCGKQFIDVRKLNCYGDPIITESCPECIKICIKNMIAMGM